MYSTHSKIGITAIITEVVVENNTEKEKFKIEYSRTLCNTIDKKKASCAI